MFAERMLNLCHEIEKLPAGEQQTKVSIMASELQKEIQAQEDSDLEYDVSGK